MEFLQWFITCFNIFNLLISTLITVCCVNVPVRYQTGESEYMYSANETTTQEKIDQLRLPKDQILVVRIPSNNLLKYTSYKDVSILHFRVPADTRTAFFTFKAFEESKSAFQRKCKPRDVTLYLKASSYPVISPENITFPRNFLSEHQRYKIYNLQFQSNEIQQRISVNGPVIGNWFAIAFVSWTDPNTDRIEQQGIAASCETLLLAEMSVTKCSPTLLNSDQSHSANLIKSGECLLNMNNSMEKNNTTPVTDDVNKKEDLKASRSTQASSKTNTISTVDHERIYKFYVPSEIGVAKARIVFGRECKDCPDVSFSVKANALPCNTDNGYTEGLRNYYTIIKPNQTGEISVEFYVQPNAWHYAEIKFVDTPIEMQKFKTKKPLNLNINQKKSKILENSPKNIENFCNTDNVKQNEISLQYTIQFQYNKHNEPSLVQKNLNNNKSSSPTTLKKVLNIFKEPWLPVSFRNIDFYPLLRQTHREFFMFDYDLPPDTNGTVPAFLNLTAGRPAGFMFEIGEVYDIGGTLSFGLSMKHGLKDNEDVKSKPLLSAPAERTGILAEKLVGLPLDAKLKNSLEEKSKPRSNQTIIVCMHHDEPGVPTWPDKCRFGQTLLPASTIVNNTDLNTSTGLVHVPFPESGQWYVTMGLYCHGAETAARATIIENIKEFIRLHGNMIGDMSAPCACANSASSYLKCVNNMKCLASLNETETLKVKECLLDSKCTEKYIEMTRRFEIHHKAATEQHLALENCNSSVVFTISSSPCVAGRCGRFGRCYHYMSGGFVFSTCVCMKGYRGWDCTEDSQVPSSISILLASLFLTLSNLLFFPSIYVAFKRTYYTEAIIYFFAMFFSIFYHACDSGEDEYSFCLVKIGVLQFCDFYCGLLAIWVTLVAMAHIRQQFVSLLHMFGAILLAFGTELNKQSLWVFLAPALTGICIISVSWGLRCFKSKKMFPSRKYLTIWMPLGSVMVMVGLVCFAFLQTKQNYHIVHSIWHMVMALSLLCLLPARKTLTPKC